MTTPMHWSRWGDPDLAADLPDAARALVEQVFSPQTSAPSAALDAVSLSEPLAAEQIRALQDLVGDENVRVDQEARVRHTRGKSTPDLLRMRAGDGSDAPGAVVLPGTHDEVLALIEWCSEHRVALVPFGGGTSVVGGLTASGEGLNGVVAVDLSRLRRLVSMDVESGTAVLEAGLLGPEAEELLAEHGLTIGHFPQSFQYASLGGFAATRSSGQASAGYGRFDALVVGLTVATPIGTLELGTSPASAAGPDLRQLVLGSEGAFGVITSMRLRVRHLPEVSVYEGWRFETFEAGAAAMRALAQSGHTPTVLRLSDEAETAINLAKPAEFAGESSGGCLMITGFEGTADEVESRSASASALLKGLGGASLGTGPGEAWAAGRYYGPYLRDSLLDIGVLVETLETAAFWSDLPSVYSSVVDAITASLTDQGTPPIVACHISHVYETGASLYFTVACRQDGDGLAQWQAAKAAATDAMVAAGATITHHHAVGRDHKPWLTHEIGPVGVEVLRAVKARLDPAGILNPGVLVP